GRLEFNRELKGFEQCGVFGDVVIVMADPFCDAHHLAVRFGDHHSNAGRSGAAVGTAIDMSDQIGHSVAFACGASSFRRADKTDRFESSIPFLSLPQFLWILLWKLLHAPNTPLRGPHFYSIERECVTSKKNLTLHRSSALTFKGL